MILMKGKGYGREVVYQQGWILGDQKGQQQHIGTSQRVYMWAGIGHYNGVGPKGHVRCKGWEKIMGL